MGSYYDELFRAATPPGPGPIDPPSTEELDPREYWEYTDLRITTAANGIGPNPAGMARRAELGVQGWEAYAVTPDPVGWTTHFKRRRYR